VYVVCRILFWVQELAYADNWGLYKLGGGWWATLRTPHRQWHVHRQQQHPTTHPCHTVAAAGVIANLGDGPEDSEFEDLEDEFDV